MTDGNLDTVNERYRRFSTVASRAHTWDIASTVKWRTLLAIVLFLEVSTLDVFSVFLRYRARFTPTQNFPT